MMQTQTAINSKKPLKKTTTSAKPVKTKSTQKPVAEGPLKAATIAKAHGIDPKKFRKALRAQNVRAPYNAAEILKIEKLAKEMAKAH